MLAQDVTVGWNIQSLKNIIEDCPKGVIEKPYLLEQSAAVVGLFNKESRWW